jgi:hypothetical protein
MKIKDREDPNLDPIKWAARVVFIGVSLFLIIFWMTQTRGLSGAEILLLANLSYMIANGIR